jgi:hypothetical protein
MDFSSLTRLVIDEITMQRFNQFINVAAAEKPSALETEDSFLR